jgi:hypothetical protein
MPAKKKKRAFLNELFIKSKVEPGGVAQTYYPRYLRGRDREDYS